MVHIDYKNLVTRLKANDAYLSITEAGYGMRFSNKLLEAPGASAVIEYAGSPYSKRFDIEGVRAVSMETVIKRVQPKLESDANTFIATSFQDGVGGKCGHGWVAINYKHKICRVVHVTFGLHTDKTCINMWVALLLERLLIYVMAHSNTQLPSMPINCPCKIDGVFDINGNFRKDYMPDNFGPFIIDKHNKWQRAVSVLRDVSGPLGIVKGSFNPYHKGHEHLFKLSVTKHAAKTLLSLTCSTTEGKEASVRDLCRRAEAIPHSVLIDQNKKTFIKLLKYISKYATKVTHFILPVGDDVFRKIDFTDFDKKEIRVHAIVVPREEYKLPDSKYTSGEIVEAKFPGVSSTKIRENEDEFGGI